MSEHDHEMDAAWLCDIATFCIIASSSENRYLWPEDIANLKSISAEHLRLAKENVELTKEVDRLREFATERTACAGCGERIAYSRADDPGGVATLAAHIKSESHREAVKHE